MSATSRATFGRLGLVALAILFVVAVSLSNQILRGARLDLTENKLYTLSPGTERTLAGIEEPINLYFFFSDRATADVPFLRAYAERVRDMLREFEQAAGGKLRLTEIDPVPFSDEEDRASQFGLQGIRLDITPDPVFMGIAGTNSIGEDRIIPFLDPTKEPFLEYELAKLVYSLAHPRRPVVGLLSGLPMTVGFDPATQQIRQPWAITEQLQQLFELRVLDANAGTIPAEVQVLMVVHPKNLSEPMLYALDQFILRGGRALLCVDPWSEIDPGEPGPMGAAPGSRSSDLGRIFDAWGLQVSADSIIGDERYALQVIGADQRPVRALGLLGIDAEGLDPDDVVTSGLTALNFAYAGALSLASDAPATLAPLVQSSTLAGLIPTASLGFMSDPGMLREGFEPDGRNHTLAARVSGKVPSAFAAGPPAGASAGPAHVAAAEQPITVVVVADTDFLSDRLWVQVQDFFGQRLSNVFANNGDFVVATLDNLLGSGDLVGIRARATFSRPFTRVQELRRTAEESLRLTEERLKQQLRDTEDKLGELQSRREDRDALILSPEQEQEIERFRQQRLEIRRELRQVQRNLDRDIERLGNALKALNIGLVPLLISIASLALLWAGRARRRARAAS
jgi:ABC-type uncharacterized transport system involved in gliding motility auxiliary subunit